MRNFILKSSVFGLVLILLLLVFVILNKTFANFKYGANKDILILGHSHAELSYNDSLINGVINVGKSAESYFYTYYKTKKIIEQNPQIKIVLIEFTNNQIEKLRDEWIWSDKYMLYRFPSCGLFLDSEGYQLLFEKNSKALFTSSKELLKYNIKKTFTGFKYNKLDMGGYVFLKREGIDSILAHNPIVPKTNNCSVSKININYLRKMIFFLKRQNKKIFLIRSPLHIRYEGYSNEKQFQNILKNQFSDISFLDFSKFPLLNNEFADLEHLNYKGARKFSIWFNYLLENGLFRKLEQQKYIDLEINKLK